MCRNIVRGDFNEIGTLVYHKLLDGKIFVAEYYWIILKTWDLLKDEIIRRRETIGPVNYMEHFEEPRDKDLKYAEKHHKEVYRQYLKAPADKRGENGKK